MSSHDEPASYEGGEGEIHRPDSAADTDQHGVDAAPTGHTATPFALLLNAISTGQPDAEEYDNHQEALNIDALLAKSAADEKDSSASHEAQAELVQYLSQLVAIASRSEVDDVGPSLSKVEVWHPTTGQKSYGKERRILNPPPILRVSGPLSHSLTSATLATTESSGSDSLTSQTHLIPLAYQATEEEEFVPDTSTPAKMRKLERQNLKRKVRETALKSGFAASLALQRNKQIAREREQLRTGLSFSGLWVAEEVGKAKDFLIALELGPPGGLAYMPAGPHRDPVGDQLGNLGGVMDDSTAAIVDHLRFASDMGTLANEDSNMTPSNQDQPSPSAWAKFTSSPVSIVSKPSQKTAKARSMATCLFSTSSFALWMRINAQAVRTKYMYMDDLGQRHLTARSGKWSPFHFQVVYRCPPLRINGKAAAGRFKLPEDDPNVITYGSVVRLIDRQSGIATGPLRLVKVEKNEVSMGNDDGRPVSELQRIGLVRMLDENTDDSRDGSRWYLSAPSARVGGGETLPPKASNGNRVRKGTASNDTSSLQDNIQATSISAPAAKRRKTRRNALAEAIVAEEEEGSLQSVLTWSKAVTVEANLDNAAEDPAFPRRVVERVEDWMCWVISGVDSFTYEYGDLPSGSENRTKFDTVSRELRPPLYNAETHTLTCVLSLNAEVSLAHGTSEIYLGPLGPLSISLWRSTAPKDVQHDEMHQAVPLSNRQRQHPVWSDFPGHLAHVIVVVELPRVQQIIRTIHNFFGDAQNVTHDKVPTGEEGQPDKHSGLTVNPIDDQEDHAWMADFDPSAQDLPGDLDMQAVIAQAAGGGDQSVTDLELALRAVHPDTFLDPSFGTTSLSPPPPPTFQDPTMSAEGHRSADMSRQAGSSTTSTENYHMPVELSLPQPSATQNDTFALPFFLVKRDEGVVCGLGHGMTAHQIGVNDAGEVVWGLRVAKRQ